MRSSLNALSDHDRERVHQLLEDVATIAPVVSDEPPPPREIRAVLAPVMRRWIVEGGFFRVQRLMAPAEIQFSVGINKDAEHLCDIGYFEHWMAIVLFGKRGVGASQPAEDWISKPPPARGGEFRQLPHPAKAFFNQKMFFWKGRFYTRHDVILMHARKLGGVHLDFRRAEDEAHIDEIKNYFGFDREPSVFRMLRGADIAAARADPDRRPGIYDATELVTFDTARIFAAGVRSSALPLKALLK